MKKSVRLADIGAQLGVSTVTVSKALSGQKGVSDTLRKQIVELAGSMGYVPPSKEPRQAKNRSYTLGVLVGERYIDKYDSFYLEMYKQITGRAIARECFAVMEPVSVDAEKNHTMPKLVTENRVDGIIVMGRLSWGYLEFLNENSSLPMIYLDFCDNKKEADAVISDSYYGAYRLTNYLFEMGHKRIGYLGTVLATGSITDRYMGYLRAMMEHGCEVRPEWIIDDREKEQGSIDAESYIRLPKELPTAFVCNCDLAASFLIKKLEAEGLKVPQDISVVGYDNYIYPGMCDVEITTYEVDIKEMARRAVHTLIKKISGEDYRHRVYIVEGQLVIKGSVKDIGNRVGKN